MPSCCCELPVAAVSSAGEARSSISWYPAAHSLFFEWSSLSFIYPVLKEALQRGRCNTGCSPSPQGHQEGAEPLPLLLPWDTWWMTKPVEKSSDPKCNSKHQQGKKFSLPHCACWYNNPKQLCFPTPAGNAIFTYQTRYSLFYFHLIPNGRAIMSFFGYRSNIPLL